jgi:hypothetical protein
VSTEAVAVVRAVGADWHVEIVSDNSVRHIPWGAHDHTLIELYKSLLVVCGVCVRLGYAQNVGVFISYFIKRSRGAPSSYID